jgi:CRP/FNR family transcriptional regulator, cyclic AMP receptor protein
VQSRGRSNRADGMVRVLEHDPELGLGVPPDRISEARAALVAPGLALGPGMWEVPAGNGERARLGFLLVRGFVARDMTLAGTTSTELVGEGELVHHRVLWHVLEPTQLAVLDDSFMRLLVRWPTVMGALLDREIRRTARMAVHQAILQLTPVETRLLVMFWHLAERWGRVSPAGITLRLRLPHQLLGQLVGCRRASVTTALGHVDESGLVVKRSDGTWLLRGSPPDELAELHWPQFVAAHGHSHMQGVRASGAGSR